MKAFDTKEELKAYSKENHYSINATNVTTEEILEFILENQFKFLYLVGANLSDANLTFAHLRGADLRGIKYNTGTIFPQGFKIPESTVMDKTI